MVQNLILVLITTIFINNVLLNQFLGLCSFLGVSKKTETAVGMGGAVFFFEKKDNVWEPVKDYPH